MTTNSQVSIQNLNQLIQRANHPEIQHYDALMKALFGNKHVAIKVFNRLLRWLPCAKRADGAVYKSARELAEETASAEISVARTRGILERIGFDIFLKKANGAPTNHFKLNLNRFLKTLAQVFNTTVEQIRQWLDLPAFSFASKRQNPSDQGDRNETHQADKVQPVKVIETITKEDNNKTLQKQNNTDPSPVLHSDSFKDENSDLIDEIEDMRVLLSTSTSMIQNWIGHYGINRVREVIAQGREMERNGQIYKSLFGWVRATLKQQSLPQPAQKSRNSSLGMKYAQFIRR